MNLFSRLPRKKTKIDTSLSNKEKKTDRKILVISGGGFRGSYALGILKAIEEKNIKNQIDAIYGVSIGAIVGASRSYGLPADEILKLLTSISIRDFYGSDMLLKSGGFVSNKKIAEILKKHLPKNFEELQIPFYAGTVDTNTATFQIFNSGDLHKIVLGSMSIPGIFPPVKYLDYSLVDGGVLNNFPVDLAKKEYPHHKIIGIALNKFKTNQKIRSAFDNLQINFEVMMRSKLIENTKFVDYLFYRELPISVLYLSKKQMHKAFALGYQDGIEIFSNQ